MENCVETIKSGFSTKNLKFKATNDDFIKTVKDERCFISKPNSI